MAKKASESVNRVQSQKQTVKSDMKPVKTSSGIFVVRGQVFRGDKVYAGVLVRAVDKDVSSEDRLGEAVTDGSGRYEIRYREQQFRRSKSEVGGADLIIRVMDAKGVIIASSGKINNASREEIIDVVIKEKPSALITKLRRQNKTRERTYSLVSTFSVGKQPGKGDPAQAASTIRQALKLAAKGKADMVDLRVRQGKFKGDIVIDRPTRIIGTAAKGEGGVIIDGSVINEDGHYLVMKNVQILARKNFGISQKGGILDMENIAIESVSRAINREAAIHISRGARALIKSLQWRGYNASALYVTGAGTKVVVSGLSISRFKFAPAFIEAMPFPATGVIEVGDNATLLAEWCALDNNDYVGIYVHSGGRMHFRNGWVDGTKAVATSQGTIGGANFVFTSGAKVELRNFMSRNAGFGIILQDAYLTAETGIIKGNTVGISFNNLPAGYKPLNCMDSVSFVGNGTRTGGTSALPLPPAPGSVPDRSSCPVIVWA